MAAVIDHSHFRGTVAASHGMNRSGTVENIQQQNIQQRLSTLESSVAEIRADVSAIKATLPHLATEARLQREAGSIRTELHKEIGTIRTDPGRRG